MTRTMRMGENTIATKFGSWKAEAQGAADLVEPRKLSPMPMVWKAEKQLLYWYWRDFKSLQNSL